MSKSPFAFNAALKEAAAKGELDDNPNFKKAVESSGINKGSVAKEGKMTRTARKLEKTSNPDSDVLAALKAQLLTTKAPARRASIQNQIDKINEKNKKQSLPTKPPEEYRANQRQRPPRDIFKN
tara:strand:+ start:192 stop:563 length:372 start_codon:yes stop_codon:yes gene_type:complete